MRRTADEEENERSSEEYVEEQDYKFQGEKEQKDENQEEKGPGRTSIVCMWSFFGHGACLMWTFCLCEDILTSPHKFKVLPNDQDPVLGSEAQLRFWGQAISCDG